MITHPSYTQLNDYADRELPEKARARVSSHLAKCTECRSTVMTIRNMTEEANKLYDIKAPEGALSRILERYAAGERVILPVADPPARRVTAWGPRRAAAAAAIVLVVGASMFSVEDIGAERAELTLGLLGEARGQTFDVTFKSTTRFAGQEFVRVRSRFRVADDQGRSTEGREAVVGQLLRDDERTFEGILQLPESAVYAVFAVEDESGESIEHNGGLLWEYIAEGPDGNPTQEALVQKQLDLTGRDWDGAYETAVEMTTLYPNSPHAWGLRAAFAQLGLDAQQLDSLAAVYTAAFESMDRLYADSTIPADQISWMMLLARRLGSDRADYWSSRLQAEAPTNERAVQDRLFEIEDAYGHDRQAHLQQLNHLWTEAGPVRSIARAGHELAVELGEPRAILAWARRREAADPTAVLALAEELAGIPALRREGIRRLRSQLESMDAQTDATRALHRSGREHRVRRAADKRRIMTALGEALIAAQEIEAGLDTLAQVVEDGWEVEAFWVMAQAYDARGDTAAAAAMYANVFVDPGTSADRAAQAAAAAQRLMASPEWESTVDQAREEMHRRTLAESVPRGLGSDATPVTDAHGRSHRLQDLVSDHVTLIILSHRYCIDCVREFPGLRGVLRHLRNFDDVTAMVITQERFSESAELQQLVTERGLDIPVYYDTERKAQQALNAWDIPGYFVLDREGRVRFSANSFEEVVRQVEALRATEGA